MQPPDTMRRCPMKLQQYEHEYKEAQTAHCADANSHVNEGGCKLHGDSVIVFERDSTQGLWQVIELMQLHCH
jgi:hypothetical protein